MRLSLKLRTLRRKSLRDNLEVLVCSPGGTGTTAFLLHLSQFSRTNHPHDKDGLKHLPYPPIFQMKKILFIWAPPRDSFESLRRRGWIRRQLRKMGFLAGICGGSNFSRYCFFSLFANQYVAFRFASVVAPSLVHVISYEDLFESGESLGKFLGITNPRFVSDFPKRVSRNRSTNHHS